MPEVSLKLLPGVNADFTKTLNQAGISSSNLIRFKDKLPQKLGGWTRFYPNALSGIPRDIHGWADLNSNNWLAIGTTTQLVVISSGNAQNITPQTLVSNFAPGLNISTTNGSPIVGITDPNTSNLTTLDAVYFNTPISIGGLILTGLYPITTIVGTSTYNITASANATSTGLGAVVPSFSTTSGSSTVLVTFPAHGLSAGGSFTFPIATTGAGVTILGTYPVIAVPSSNTFTISVANSASSSATFNMNGGNAQLLYYITLGPTALGTGFGLGGFGIGGFGTGVVPASQTGTPITTTDWSMDNWGQDWIGCPRGGPIYFWQPGAGYQTAALVATGPTFNNGLFVAMPEQILVAWGSTLSSGQQDPLLVRWSDSQDFTNWTVTSTTQAGSFHIPTGSKIMGGYQGPQQALIWTDLDLYAMQYLGPPFVFGFNKLSSGCGLIGPHARTSMRGNVYWMTSGSFFVLSGNGVQQIPCSVWDIVFQDLDTNNQTKCVAAANSQFDEVSFFYPSLSGKTGECDSYVKLNVSEGSWDYGKLARSTWQDQSVLGQPIGTTPSAIIYQHETSNDADGQPLVSTFTTGYFVLSEGQDIPFVDWLFPDMRWGFANGPQTASVQITINVVAYPNATPQAFGPFTMSQAVDFINLRLRGRQIAFSVTSSDLGSWWRWGNTRIRVNKMGRR
ncbi:hypothetical protein IC762_12345 [Bradyrhizobium genosp. L]|uniref:hypothetical protein n=1 Tax=Bradyrhizobium genosp. L TaxID=83637 RepID=UPI0018A31E05|nr:hypothetical protein [Bradyrhizobium genosp. L]QPF87035.1 hypothetical protein IC762_12345 [Bradyrhizobium genosp. L]